MLSVLQQVEWLYQSENPPVYSEGKPGPKGRYFRENDAIYISNKSLQIYWLGKKCYGVPDGPGVEVNILAKTIYVGGFANGEYDGYGCIAAVDNQIYYEGWWDGG
jgi:hypothetical protein